MQENRPPRLEAWCDWCQTKTTNYIETHPFSRQYIYYCDKHKSKADAINSNPDYKNYTPKKRNRK